MCNVHDEEVIKLTTTKEIKTMTMKKYYDEMMYELYAGNNEEYNRMNKCLRESGYNPTEAYVAYINIPEDACNTPANEPESDEFV